MNKVYFPLLNLELTINNIAFSIFGVDIYWYAILIVGAMIAGIIILKLRDGLYGIKFETIIDLVLYLIPISIISARLYYVLFDLDFFLKAPMQILNIRTGGIAIYGGIIGGAITCFIFCKKKNIQILDLFDYIAPALALRSSNRKMGEFCKY